ncbi:MAG: sulfatase [Candidatus Hydrogenedentota bacterium]
MKTTGTAFTGAFVATQMGGEKRAAADGSGPNVLMITCHDIGQHLSCYGVDSVQTPNLDRLAGRGVRFDNCYSTAPVCSPGRASLFTGRYPQSNGLMGLTHSPWWWSLHASETHLAELLRDAGYETYLVGLSHLGRTAEGLGFEHRLSPQSDAQETVQETCNLIRNGTNHDKPFYIQAGFRETHPSSFDYERRDTEKGLHVPGWLEPTEAMEEDLAVFQGTIQYFDERVGEILDALEQSEVRDNTLVIMTSDHGMGYPGAKWTLRKAGVEVPLILHYPDSTLSGGKIFHDVISNVDVLPTLFDYLGLEPPGNVEGYSFRQLIDGDTEEGPRREAYSQYTVDMRRNNESRSIITERYHLIRYFSQGRAVSYPTGVDPREHRGHVARPSTTGTRPFAQLYDLENDPYELQDIGGEEENEAIVADLSKRLLAWMRDVDDPLLGGPVRQPYYERSIEDLLEKGDG